MSEQYVIFHTSNVRDAEIVAYVLKRRYEHIEFKSVGCAVSCEADEFDLGDLHGEIMSVAEAARLASCISRVSGSQLTLENCEACELETVHAINDPICEDCRADEREAVRYSGYAGEITETEFDRIASRSQWIAMHAH